MPYKVLKDTRIVFGCGVSAVIIDVIRSTIEDDVCRCQVDDALVAIREGLMMGIACSGKAKVIVDSMVGGGGGGRYLGTDKERRGKHWIPKVHVFLR